MLGSNLINRRIIEGRAVLIVIDIQASTFIENETRSIAHA